MDAPRRFLFFLRVEPRYWLPVMVAVLAPMSVANATDADNPARPDDLTPSEMREPEEPEKPWQENLTLLPAFPRARDLLPVRAPSGGFDYKYYIDVNSVTFTPDEVVRYTIIIQPSNGSSNIIYEGIRCATQEVKIFAYGTKDGRFERIPDPQWTYVHTKGAMAYRTSLVETYMCDEDGWGVDRDTVLERLVRHDPRRPRVAPKTPEASN